MIQTGKRPTSHDIRHFCRIIPIIACLVACHKNNPDTNVTAKGNRLLGIEINQANNEDYAAAYARARLTGINCIPFMLQWTSLEQNGLYDPQGLLTDLNDFYSDQPVSLSLCISPFAANLRDFPPDLSTLPFDDTAVIGRFERLMDTVTSKLPGITVRFLLIGDEADLYLNNNPNQWAAYIRFCTAVRQHVLASWPKGLQVGAETTLGSGMGSDSQLIQTLNDSMDVVGVTCYPLQSNFMMAPVSTVSGDIAALLNIYAGRQVIFQECGYATSPVCGGSDTAQQSFVSEMFRLWDEHIDQIPMMSFLWLTDLSDSNAQAVTAEYGLTASPMANVFTGYVQSLGLSTWEGTSKPGFMTLQQEAWHRGW